MIATPPLIPAEQWAPLSLAIAQGNTDQVKRLVEGNNLDVNAFLDNSSWMPVLMEALLSNGFASENDRLPLLRYLLERGANPNIRSRRGYNCLHIAVQQEKYIFALDLMLDFNADVNVTDTDGANIVYWAIQGFLLRKEQGANRPLFLSVLEKILLLGADLDQKTNHDMTARGWLSHAAPEVRELVARVEANRPSVRKVYTVQPAFPTNLSYPDLARKIWIELVPPSGPAGTVHGELLRSVENLRDEAQQNKNSNYSRQHRRMALFVRDTLLRSGAFDRPASDRIRSGTRQLMKASKPYTDDDVYDHLVDQVCVFYSRAATPMAL